MKFKSDPRLKAAFEVLEAYGLTGVKPTNLGNALAQVNGLCAADQTPRENRGGYCLLCKFEFWFKELLCGREAAKRFVEAHHQNNPNCTGQFVADRGDKTEEEMWLETMSETNDR